MTKDRKLSIARLYTVAALGGWEPGDPMAFAMSQHYKQITEVAKIFNDFLHARGLSKIMSVLSSTAMTKHPQVEFDFSTTESILQKMVEIGEEFAVSVNRDAREYFEGLKSDPIIGVALRSLAEREPHVHRFRDTFAPEVPSSDLFLEEMTSIYRTREAEVRAGE